MSDRRKQVLDVLRASAGPMSIREVADALGVHLNTARFHLDRLSGAGRVESVSAPRTATGRPPLMYRLVRTMDQGGPTHYKFLAQMLAGSMTSAQSRERAVEQARRTGAVLAAGRVGEGGLDASEAADELVSLMADLGFAPQRHRDELALRHCPFAGLIDDQSDLICPMHLGLMQGAMDAYDAPVTVTSLDDRVEPDLCVAHFGPRTHGAS